jgi:hypothetical protein
MTEHKKTGAQVEGIHFIFCAILMTMVVAITIGKLIQKQNVYGRFYMQIHVAYKAQGSRLNFFLGYQHILTLFPN